MKTRNNYSPEDLKYYWFEEGWYRLFTLYASKELYLKNNPFPKEVFDVEKFDKYSQRIKEKLEKVMKRYRAAHYKRYSKGLK